MNLLAFLFLLAATVWLIPLLKDGRLTRIIAVLLVVGTVFGPAFFSFDGPIQISTDRLLWVVLLGLAAIQWRLGKLTLPRLTRLDVCVIALVGYLFLRSRGGDPVETRIDPTARWLFYIMMPAGVYFAARMAKVRITDFRWLLNTLIALGVYLSFTAICEVKGYTAFVFPKHILDPDVWEFYGRGRGPLLNPAGNGFVIGVAMSAVAACFVGAGRHAKAVYAALGVILLVGGYATLTRSCWLGIAGAVAIVGLIHSPRWVRVLGLSAAVLLAAAMAMGLKEELMTLKRDKQLSAVEAAKSIELRPLLATVAWEMFKDKPLMGHGFGHYFQHHDHYHTIRQYGIPLERVRKYGHHNVFLAFLVDSGLIGFTLFVSLLVMLFGYGWSMACYGAGTVARRRVGLFCVAVLASYFPNAMFHDMTIIPMVQLFLFATAGLTLAIYQNGFTPEPAVQRWVDQRLTAPLTTPPTRYDIPLT
ncbi:O-antigen ligase family protein [Stieleria sp. TO1_6]|uniref:O-antigen ligase family protein n=1 Tax=Stieleria tagensis TaxID=2956795 RepID=UPI00209AEBC6|nr:O-antigen ligase family protein [Stieleria tagensis]MCO8120369.1 O-antigen ligase family protein [Stieleria tagensis]